MHKVASVAVTLACVGLMGCQQALYRQESQGRPETKSQYRPAVWPFLYPAAQYKCDKSNAYPCESNIYPYCFFLKCSATLDNDPLILARGKNDIDITWTLPPGFGFCASLGDGVFLKLQDDYDQDEFDQMKPVGAASGPKNECTQQYHWRGHNKKSRPDKPYEYRIVFHDDSNKIYTLDPWILNE